MHNPDAQCPSPDPSELANADWLAFIDEVKKTLYQLQSMVTVLSDLKGDVTDAGDLGAYALTMGDLIQRTKVAVDGLYALRRDGDKEGGPAPSTMKV